MRKVLAAALLAASCAIDFPDYPAGDITGASAIGQACGSDADCSGGTCWAEGMPMEGVTGSPERGLCTMPCELDRTCPAGTVCYDFGPLPLCVLRCSWGTELADKCGGRTEVGCEFDDEAGGRCVPILAGTAHCKLGVVGCEDCVVGGAVCEGTGLDLDRPCISGTSGAELQDWRTCPTDDSN